eukprot:m.201520 g.201520  ORF g.201520 m.201520 type:complete len:141 (-) comp15745_c0_seq5:245-667(-)
MTGCPQDVWKELPEDWLDGLDVKKKIASVKYNTSVNRYKVNCGAKVDKKDEFGLLYWESKQWIVDQDPYGWFHWYCRFYQGRRSDDDGRQISRWMKVCGDKGRWKQNLIGKCLQKGKVSLRDLDRKKTLLFCLRLTMMRQ